MENQPHNVSEKSANQPNKSFRKNKKQGGQPKIRLDKQDYEKSLKALKQQHASELKDIHAAINGIKSGGVLVDAVDKIQQEHPGRGKLPLLEKLVGIKFLASKDYIGPEFLNMPYKEKLRYVEAAYADDLGSILAGGLKAVSPYIGSAISYYGPKLLDWLYSKVAGRQELRSNGSGQGMITLVPPRDFFSSCDMNTCSLDYLASIFCPEKYSSLIPDLFGASLVSTTRTVTQQMNADTSGNALYYFLPDMVTAANDTLHTSWQTASSSGGTANVTTGVISPNPTFVAGTYYTTGSANISRFRLSSTAYRIVPEVSALNNQGVVTLAYATDLTNDNFLNATPALPQASVLQFPCLHIANLAGTKELRQVHFPHDVTELALDDFIQTNQTMYQNGGLDLIYASLEGANPAAGVCKIYITQAIDYMPGDNAIGLVKPVMTPNAPASVPTAAILLKLIPHLAQLDLDSAMDFAAFLLSLESDDMRHVIKSAKSYSSKFKAPPKVYKSPMQQSHDGFSFDDEFAN